MDTEALLRSLGWSPMNYNGQTLWGTSGASGIDPSAGWSNAYTSYDPTSGALKLGRGGSGSAGNGAEQDWSVGLKEAPIAANGNIYLPASFDPSQMGAATVPYSANQSGWNQLRDMGEAAGSIAGNYFLPGSGIVSSRLVSNGAQQDLSTPLGRVGMIGSGVAGGINGNMSNYGKIWDAAKGTFVDGGSNLSSIGGSGSPGGLPQGMTAAEAKAYVADAADPIEAVSRLAEVGGGTASGGAQALGYNSADAALGGINPAWVGSAAAGLGGINGGGSGGGGGGGMASNPLAWMSAASLGTSLLGANAAKTAASEQAGAADRATQANLSMFNTLNDQQAPWRQAGQNALGDIAANQPYFSHQFGPADLKAGLAPNYDFQLEQGLNATKNAANMQTGLVSGNAMRAVNDYAQNYAGNAYQNAFNNFNTNQSNIFNRLSTIAGFGSTANNQSTTSGTAIAGNVGNTISNSGAAQAAGTVGAANALNGGINGAASWYSLPGIVNMMKPNQATP